MKDILTEFKGYLCLYFVILYQNLIRDYLLGFGYNMESGDIGIHYLYVYTS